MITLVRTSVAVSAFDEWCYKQFTSCRFQRVRLQLRRTGLGAVDVTDLLSEVRHLGPRVDLFVGEIFVPIPELQQLLCSPGFCGSEMNE